MIAPPLWRTKPYTCVNPSPVLLPTAFVIKKRLEDPVEHLGRHAAAGIVYRDADISSRGDLEQAGRLRGIEIDIARFDHQLPAVRHGVARVDGEVQYGCLKLRRIDLAWKQVAMPLIADADGVADRASDQLGAFGEDFGKVDRAPPQRLPPRKRQQPLDDPLGALDPTKRGLDELAGTRVVAANEAVKKFKIAADDLQQVVEIVRHTPGQLADRLHLLCVVQLLFDRFAFAGAFLDPLFERLVEAPQR